MPLAMDNNDSQASSILVLGIGNVLWADEGFGVRAVEALHRRFDVPPQVTVLDGGTQGLYLLPYIQACSELLVIDAIDYGLPPATIHIVRDDEVPSFMGAKKMSLHQTGFQEVLAAAQLLGWQPRHLTLIGVQPQVIDDYGGSLRPEVAARIDEVIQLAVAELGAWKVTLRPREAIADQDGLAAPALALDHYEGQRPSSRDACRLGDARFLVQASHAETLTDTDNETDPSPMAERQHHQPSASRSSIQGPTCLDSSDCPSEGGAP
ncbi:HyaD/HybD family hydrogenase maturation endopeptidase [Halomonas denitrificans]|uniref:HyaD/HybD family hydrogenase maturation endopeptidase n=1 Tax=Halomonas denitrificans TaxID=370769 RepID=UPI001CD502CE|nr:HyaD/HybD family hydrogenase maturation endopeptidase [Halomonas denitrificans]MCA0973120.1 HyaD/HybD family hydrogenase maturation endopeptidase [Halomonas denitrificans]